MNFLPKKLLTAYLKFWPYCNIPQSTYHQLSENAIINCNVHSVQLFTIKSPSKLYEAKLRANHENLRQKYVKLNSYVFHLKPVWGLKLIQLRNFVGAQFFWYAIRNCSIRVFLKKYVYSSKCPETSSKFYFFRYSNQTPCYFIQKSEHQLSTKVLDSIWNRYDICFTKNLYSR